MRRLLRLAAGILTAFAVTFLLSLAEPITPIPAQPAILAVALTAVLAGLLTGSGLLAAVSAVSGSLAALLLALWLGVVLYNPSPIPSDLYMIRLMLIGLTGLLASGVGYVLGGVSGGKTVGAKPAEVTGKKTASVVPEVGQVAESRVCKFCTSIIPAESVYCPMCGTKLVEE